MHHRCLATVYTVAAVVMLAPAFVFAQSAPSMPLTEWGASDLRGIWNNSTLTPFERPEALGDQEFLSEEEAASIEQRTADRNRDLENRAALRTVACRGESVAAIGLLAGTVPGTAVPSAILGATRDIHHGLLRKIGGAARI